MKLKGVACVLFFLNTALFATYYAVSKEAMGRIDPIIFSFCEMVTLAPVAVCILIWTWQDVNRAILKQGMLLGGWLCLSLFTIAIALKYTTATSTAFFPSLNGLLAALIAWMLLRQPIRKSTWFAGAISVIGTVLLISVSSMGDWRGTLIAFLGGVFFTFYVFLSDQEQGGANPWSLFAVETLTMAVCATFIALLFGNWQAVHPQLPKDAWVILYIAGATTFLPILITVTMQKHVSAVTVSFIYILEPVLGALFANFYLHETLPSLGYVGGGLVVVGAVIHTIGSALPAKKKRVRTTEPLRNRQRSRWYAAPAAIACYFMLFLGTEFALLYGLGGFPPQAWRDLYTLWPGLATLAQNGQMNFVVLLWVQAICWLVAWLASIVMSLLAVRYLVGKLWPAEEEAALRYYLSREQTRIIPTVKAVKTVKTVNTIPGTRNRPIARYTYPVRPASYPETPEERELVEEFLREYM